MVGFGKKARCGRVRGMLSEYIDSRLDDRRRSLVEGHLETCEACTKELESLQMTVQLLQGMPEVPAPRSFAIREPETARESVPAQRGTGRPRLAPVFATGQAAGGGVSIFDPQRLRWLRPATAVALVALVALLMLDFFQVVPHGAGIEGGELFATPPAPTMASPATERDADLTQFSDEEPAPSPADKYFEPKVGLGEGGMVGEPDTPVPAVTDGGGWPLRQIEIALGVMVLALLSGTLYVAWRRAKRRAA